MLEIIFNYQFMRNALIASVLSSILCGIIGVIVVEKKLVMMSGGIAHTSYGGVGLGYFLGFEPIIGAFLFSITAAVGMGFAKRKGKINSDAVIGMFWSLGMALGILFIKLMNGYPPDISSYLFGNILAVTMSNLYMMIALTALVSLCIIMFFNHWKAYLFDEEFTSVIGVKKVVMDFALLIMIAMSVVVLIRVAGIVLVIALLTVPAATSALLSNKLKNRMIISIILGIIYCFSGLTCSYYLDIPSGATIVVLSVLCYTVLSITKAIALKAKNKKYLQDKDEVKVI